MIPGPILAAVAPTLIDKIYWSTCRVKSRRPPACRSQHHPDQVDITTTGGATAEPPTTAASMDRPAWKP